MERLARPMIVGIDAHNIRAGGGVTHLVELLRVANPERHGFSKIVVWSGMATLQEIESRPWLEKSHQALLDKPLPHRIWWQRFRLSKLARQAGCDVLFVLGGSYAGDFHPMVTFNQNLLPFEWRELRRYGWSWMTLKMLILRIVQGRTFERAEGLIFLTKYAREAVARVVKTADYQTIVPHGIDVRFVEPPREQLPIARYSAERPYRVLYVSIIDMYKHQWKVAEAVAELRDTGLPVTLELIGRAYPPAMRRLNRTLDRIDKDRAFVRYSGPAPHSQLRERYAAADLAVFASTCETFGLILTEAMSAGLPIACSKRSAMPELLGDAGVYFDPENASDIARAIRELMESPELRRNKAQASFQRAKAFSWEQCADSTFGFLRSVAAPVTARP